MDVHVVEEPATSEALAAYSEVSIAFTATSRLKLDLIEGGLGGVRLTEEPLELPQLHDTDAIEGEGPLRWAKRWNLDRWRLLVAFDGNRRAGGAVVALHTDGMWFLRGRGDIAALWDIRVDPDCRRLGVGSALLDSAAAWAKAQGCRLLKIETQNVNVAACRFYMAKGAKLGALDRFAYKGLPDEVELDWFLEL